MRWEDGHEFSLSKTFVGGRCVENTSIVLKTTVTSVTRSTNLADIQFGHLSYNNLSPGFILWGFHGGDCSHCCHLDCDVM
jgi:hypothetical protein